MDEKKSIWKKIGIAIGSFIAALLTFICFGTINKSASDKRRRADETRDNLDKADAANRDARDRVGQLKDTVEHVEQLNDDIAESNRECQDIIRNVRQRNNKRKD